MKEKAAQILAIALIIFAIVWGLIIYDANDDEAQTPVPTPTEEPTLTPTEPVLECPYEPFPTEEDLEEPALSEYRWDLWLECVISNFRNTITSS